MLFGIMLTTVIALLANTLGSWLTVIGGPVFGILLGMLTKATGRVPAAFKPGITFCSKKVLQASIIMLGAGLSLRQIITTGADSLAVMLITLSVALLTAWLVGRAMKIPSNLTVLLGAGTGICGASAIAAVAPVVEAEEQEVAYAISTIFAFNVAAVLLFPALGHLLGLGEPSFGLLAGTAINDTSSVVAAAYSYGAEAGAYATVVKLTRSTLIIPLALGLAALRGLRRKDGAGASVKVSRLVPWFIVWFLVAALLNTAGLLPPPLPALATKAAKFLIVVALTAVGLSADFRQMARTGWKPLLLGGVLWLAVTATSLAVQALTGQLM